MMYWVYDLPNWLFGLYTVAAFLAFGGIGLWITEWYFGYRTKPRHEANEVVSYYFTAIVGFYGITLGLVSVGTWQTFADADNKSTVEAAAIEALYRDLGAYPEPPRTAMQDGLKEYTKNVIETAWPMQRKGQTPTGGTARMNVIADLMFPFEPKTQGQMAIHQEALKQFNKLSEVRRLRVLSATGGLPATMWWVIVAGAVIVATSLACHSPFLSCFTSQIFAVRAVAVTAQLSPDLSDHRISKGAPGTLNIFFGFIAFKSHITIVLPNNFIASGSFITSPSGRM